MTSFLIRRFGYWIQREIEREFQSLGVGYPEQARYLGDVLANLMNGAGITNLDQLSAFCLGPTGDINDLANEMADAAVGMLMPNQMETFSTIPQGSTVPPGTDPRSLIPAELVAINKVRYIIHMGFFIRIRQSGGRLPYEVDVEVPDPLDENMIDKYTSGEDSVEILEPNLVEETSNIQMIPTSAFVPLPPGGGPLKTIEEYEMEIMSKSSIIHQQLDVFEENIGHIGSVIRKDSTVVYQTLVDCYNNITEEMSARTPHSPEVLQGYVQQLDSILAVLKEVMYQIDRIKTEEPINIKEEVDSAMEAINEAAEAVANGTQIALEETGVAVPNQWLKYAIFGGGTYLVLRMFNVDRTWCVAGAVAAAVVLGK